VALKHQIHPLKDLPKFTQIWIFGLENMPSSNTADEPDSTAFVVVKLYIFSINASEATK
jgi:hypothetical protein